MISIVTAYHNRKKLFLKTLESIKKSKVKDFEVIVVDDCSIDEHRLEDIVGLYPFLKLIRLEKKDKWYVNPCVPYNIGFKAAKGEIVIIQNPECYHLNDIVDYVANKLQSTEYFSFSCYSLDQNQTSNLDETISKNFIINKPTSFDGESGWYNHGLYRPFGYHFCAAIHKDSLEDLNGFDERYSDGIGFDDNEFLVRINRKGLKLKIVDDFSVLHQWHYSSNNYQRVDTATLVEKNRKLLYDITMKESGWRANEINMLLPEVPLNSRGVNKTNWFLPEIPKIMSFYWDGGRMSYLQFLTVKSFHKFNPDWQINIYIPSTRFYTKTWETSEQKKEYEGEDYYPRLRELSYLRIIRVNFEELGVSNNISEVFKSDFIRWYLLDNIGGGWSDMDILYIKALNELPLRKSMLWGLIKPTNTAIVHNGYHSIGFFLTKPKTGLFKDIFEVAKKCFDPKEYQSVGSTLLNRMFPKVNAILNKYPSLKISNLPMDSLYPYDWTKVNLLFNTLDDSLISSRTVGIHWYNGSHISKEFNNSLKKHANVLTELIRKHRIDE